MDAGFEASAKAGKEATAARFANGTTIMQTKKNKYNTQEGNKAPPNTLKDTSTRGEKGAGQGWTPGIYSQQPEIPLVGYRPATNGLEESGVWALLHQQRIVPPTTRKNNSLYTTKSRGTRIKTRGIAVPILVNRPIRYTER